MITLAALTLLWAPVTLDCLGGPESGVVYEVAYMYRTCQGYISLDPPPCDTFAVRFETTATEWQTEIGEADPPAGAAYWYEVTSLRDGAGNLGGSCL